MTTGDGQKEFLMNRIEFIRAGLLIPLAPVLLPAIPIAAAANVTAAEFVEKAGVAGKFEIASSEIAAAKTKNADIKSFAERMIKDHAAAANELKATAGSKYKVPETLDAQHQEMIDQLSAAGANLDASYVKMQVEAHAEAVKLFDSFGQHGDDAALQAFAVKTLPTLQMHYDMIKKISAARS
jgi:putative membrane protein